MVYEKEIVGRFVTLRSITEEDAEFSYNLRKDPRFVDIMGQPAESLDAQRQFIRWQRNEPGDYYFVVFDNKGTRIGLIGVYKIVGDTCEVGREINIGEPYETIEAEVLNLGFCSDILHLKKLSAVVYKQNLKQYHMLMRRGGYTITETVHNGIPSYVLMSTIEEQNNRMEKARKLINKLASGGDIE